MQKSEHGKSRKAPLEIWTMAGFQVRHKGGLQEKWDKIPTGQDQSAQTIIDIAAISTTTCG